MSETEKLRKQERYGQRNLKMVEVQILKLNV